jgi:hypothetical protein
MNDIDYNIITEDIIETHNCIFIMGLEDYEFSFLLLKKCYQEYRKLCFESNELKIKFSNSDYLKMMKKAILNQSSDYSAHINTLTGKIRLYIRPTVKDELIGTLFKSHYNAEFQLIKSILISNNLIKSNFSYVDIKI